MGLLDKALGLLPASDEVFGVADFDYTPDTSDLEEEERARAKFEAEARRARAIERRQKLEAVKDQLAKTANRVSSRDEEDSQPSAPEKPKKLSAIDKMDIFVDDYSDLHVTRKVAYERQEDGIEGFEEPSSSGGNSQQGSARDSEEGYPSHSEQGSPQGEETDEPRQARVTTLEPSGTSEPILEPDVASLFPTETKVKPMGPDGAIETIFDVRANGYDIMQVNDFIEAVSNASSERNMEPVDSIMVSDGSIYGAREIEALLLKSLVLEEQVTRLERQMKSQREQLEAQIEAKRKRRQIEFSAMKRLRK